MFCKASIPAHDEHYHIGTTVIGSGLSESSSSCFFSYTVSTVLHIKSGDFICLVLRISSDCKWVSHVGLLAELMVCSMQWILWSIPATNFVRQYHARHSADVLYILMVHIYNV